ncbi:hypothetical protein DCAR_0831623 [Daucus carota subsp. sativus]|uniref:Uncharacterized protein n=1 Tax=Daucus carota subsp. sativus TaxID=79200 RepID=A0AAF1BA71_DAUCS|nr:hypothetical protein DCAR_0831623 [Daucus carota subsp. sativus]
MHEPRSQTLLHLCICLTIQFFYLFYYTGSSLHKRAIADQTVQASGPTLEREVVFRKDGDHKVTVQSDLWRKWDVFYRFCRLHSVTGTVTGVISVSLLPLTSFGDLSPAFFLGLLQAVLPFAFVNIYVVTLNQLLDVGIDKINKPYLVLASGEYTMRQGKAITSAFGFMCLAMAIMFRSPPLLYGIFIHFLVGTAYSVEGKKNRSRKLPGNKHPLQRLSPVR